MVKCTMPVCHTDGQQRVKKQRGAVVLGYGRDAARCLRGVHCWSEGLQRSMEAWVLSVFPLHFS